MSFCREISLCFRIIVILRIADELTQQKCRCLQRICKIQFSMRGKFLLYSPNTITISKQNLIFKTQFFKLNFQLKLNYLIKIEFYI